MNSGSCYFVENSDRVLTREDLIAGLGKQELPIDERTVDVWVGRLRRARLGDYEEALALFEAVLDSGERVELETASGQWLDSRALERKAIAMLDRGEFAGYYAPSMR
ncbi:MAG: winged helix-turn-helix domain-containing protein [Qipengyuania sp.]